MLFQDPSGFVHQHLAPSMGIDMKSYVDYPNQHCRHQHERQSPEHRSSCDPRDLEPQLPPRPPKRKSEQHHHYIERERDRDRECERKHDHHDHNLLCSISCYGISATTAEDTKPLANHHHKE
ncbi:hypothetical protein ACFX2A_002707 [Malus domestica]